MKILGHTVCVCVCVCVCARARACVCMYICIYVYMKCSNKDFQATQVSPSLFNFCVKSEFEKQICLKKEETKEKQIVIVNSRPFLFKVIYRIYRSFSAQGIQTKK